jgi:hypothetical protein
LAARDSVKEINQAATELKERGVISETVTAARETESAARQTAATVKETVNQANR